MQDASKAAHDFVVATFPGKAFAEFHETCCAIGIATKTGYNWLHRRIFPLPILHAGGKLIVPVPAIEAYLTARFGEAAGEPVETPAVPEAGKRRRGRPRKVAVAATQTGGQP